MIIDSNFVAIFAIGVGLVITIVAILSDTISQYKLKVEKIRADAMIKAEDVRSRNQLELERLVLQDYEKAVDSRVYSNSPDILYGEDSLKPRARVKE